MDDKKFKELSRSIGYRFYDTMLLKTALTHSSFVYENRLSYANNNERLEFLGDAILDALVSEYLFEKYPDEEEGFLTKERAALVCEDALFEYGKKIELGSHLILGKGEERNGGRTRKSMIADAVEAVIGAVFLDGGWKAARKVAFSLLDEKLIQAASGELMIEDYKSLVQEKVQSEGQKNIRYVVVSSEGPDHDKTFHVDLTINGKIKSRGSGKSKKKAEQAAAKNFFESGEL